LQQELWVWKKRTNNNNNTSIASPHKDGEEQQLRVRPWSKRDCMPERKARPIACYAKQPATDYDHHCSHSLHTKSRVAKKKTLTSLIKEATNLQGKKKKNTRSMETHKRDERQRSFTCFALPSWALHWACFPCLHEEWRKTNRTRSSGLGFMVKEREREIHGSIPSVDMILADIVCKFISEYSSLMDFGP